MRVKEIDEITTQMAQGLNQLPGCIGAVLVTFWEDGSSCHSSCQIMVNADLRGVLPSVFRDLALTTEKENLMHHVKTEELNPEHTTEIVRSETRKIPRQK